MGIANQRSAFAVRTYRIYRSLEHVGAARGLHQLRLRVGLADRVADRRPAFRRHDGAASVEIIRDVARPDHELAGAGQSSINVSPQGNSLMLVVDHLIGGRRVPSLDRETLDVVAPATGGAYAKLAAGKAVD